MMYSFRNGLGIEMNYLGKANSSQIAQIAAGILLIPMWTWFGYRHVVAFLSSDEWSYLFLCISETLTVGFLLIRSYPKSVSKVPSDWVIAIVGTFSSLLFLPTNWGLVPVAKYAISLGTFLQILGMISLNRSFAIVAAKREIKTSGMYSFVRHPLYASYLITYSGYLLANTNLENLAIYIFVISCMIVRIFREERHLLSDNDYLTYTQQVPYRIIPYIF